MRIGRHASPRPLRPASERKAPTENKEPKEWTLLFYNVAQGNLSTMTSHTINDLERVGSDENTSVVVSDYREHPAHELFAGRHDGGTTYYITRHEKHTARALLGDRLGSLVDGALASPTHIKSEVLDKPALPGEAAKMSGHEALKAFILDSMERYPARQYALVLTGHGSAFQGQAVTRGPHGRAALGNDELGDVLNDVRKETGQGVGVVNLNTCFSANLETLYSLKDSTSAVVASEGELSLNTQPFGEVLAQLQNRLKEGNPVGPEELARSFVEQAANQPLSDLYTPTLSALKAGELDQVGQSVAELQKTCLEHGVAAEDIKACLEEATSINFSQEPRPVELADLGSLAAAIGRKVAAAEVKEAAAKVQSALKKAILAEHHSSDADRTLTSKMVRRLPFLVGPQKDLSGATGLTVFWEGGEKERRQFIAHSRFGADHPIERFMEFLREPGPTHS